MFSIRLECSFHKSRAAQVEMVRHTQQKVLERKTAGSSHCAKDGGRPAAAGANMLILEEA